MNPIPLSWCAAACVLTAAVGATAGWTVRDWKAGSDDKARLETAIITVEKQRSVIDAAAGLYEGEKQRATIVNNQRELEIRTYYKDVLVPANCATPPVVHGLLTASILDANARAAGQPAPGLPALTPATNTAGGPGPGELGASADRGIW